MLCTRFKRALLLCAWFHHDCEMRLSDLRFTLSTLTCSELGWCCTPAKRSQPPDLPSCVESCHRDDWCCQHWIHPSPPATASTSVPSESELEKEKKDKKFESVMDAVHEMRWAWVWCQGWAMFTCLSLLRWGGRSQGHWRDGRVTVWSRHLMAIWIDSGAVRGPRRCYSGDVWLRD